MSQGKVYCAGPIFNSSERREMRELANVLTAAGYETFLPHENGLEFAKLVVELEQMDVPSVAAQDILARAIFSLDVYKILGWADAVVANLNGRVPDEGTLVEAALAWHAGKALVLFKSDSRSMIHGADNPMWVGLAKFEVVNYLEGIPAALQAQLQADKSQRVPQTLEAGEQLAAALENQQDLTGRNRTMAEIARDLFSPASRS